MEEANRFLTEVSYLPDYNRRFTVDAAEPGTAMIPWAGGDLDEILYPKEDRVVGKDNTVAFDTFRFQIEPTPLRAHFVKATGQVRRYADQTAEFVLWPSVHRAIPPERNKHR